MIQIRLNEDNFQYDIYSLTKAFFPEEEIETIIDAKEQQKAEKSTRVLKISYVSQQVIIAYVPAIDTENFAQRVFAWESQERKQQKNQLKAALYDLLCQISGKTLPWGNLTGIRPIKIVMGMLEQGMNEEKAAGEMMKIYCISREKADLSLEIAKRQLAVLDTFSYGDGYSLYVGIPFCPTTCLYCSFTSYPIGLWQEKTGEYLQALFQELEYISKRMKGKTLDSIYIGGGTPTTLSPRELELLLRKIRKLFDCKDVKEFCVEAGRPDSITKEKLKVLKECGVERISINPQTMNEETLKVIGRHHSVSDIRRTFELAREVGFSTINMDIILGLPGEGMEHLQHTLNEIEQMKPENLTIHSLALKRAARLNLQKDYYADRVNAAPVHMMQEAERRARTMGLVPYYLYRQKNMGGNLENVGYAREGHIGLYNILIMEERQTIIAAGAGAMSKLVSPGGNITRIENVKDVTNYIQRVQEMIARKEEVFGSNDIEIC